MWALWALYIDELDLAVSHSIPCSKQPLQSNNQDLVNDWILMKTNQRVDSRSHLHKLKNHITLEPALID